MGKNKSQHYVPRVYLRNFAIDSDGKNIGAWIHKQGRYVDSAPIKSQCARPFFYGDDLILERAFQEPEAWYGGISRKLLRGDPIDASDEQFFLFFWLLQRNRGSVAVTTMHQAFGEIRRRAFDDSPQSLEFLGKELGVEEIAKIAFLQTREHLNHLNDLGVCFLANSGRIPFLASDNPAVDGNRFLHVRDGARLRNWGLGSSGLYLFMPISRSFAFLAYDKNIYALPSIERRTMKISDADTHALNYLVLLFSDNCLYFSRPGDRAYVESQLAPLAGEVPTERFRINLAAEDREISTEARKYFKVVDDEEYLKSRDGVVHMEMRPPLPRFHPSFLKFKAARRYFDSQSGAGIVRPNSVTIRELQAKRSIWR